MRTKKVILGLAAAAVISLGVAGGAYAGTATTTQGFHGGTTASTAQARAQVRAQDCDQTCVYGVPPRDGRGAAVVGQAGAANTNGAAVQQRDRTCDGTCDGPTSSTLRQRDRLHDGTCDGGGVRAATGSTLQQRLRNGNSGS